MANRRCGWLAYAGLLLFLSGCVERRFVVESTPPGAKVYVNNRPVGFTPCDVPFTYYGTYKFQLELDGHQTIIEDKRIAPPWYAYPPIDFLSENIYPLKASDIQRLNFAMSPLPRVNLDDLRRQAEELRLQGKNLPGPSIPVTPRTPPAGTPNSQWPSTVPPAPAPVPVETKPPPLEATP